MAKQELTKPMEKGCRFCRTIRLAFVIGLTGFLLAFGSPSPMGAPAPTPSCKPTPSDALGPFYKPNAPERSQVDHGYVLTGVVKSARDCSPLQGARIEIWLAAPNGRYDDAHRAAVISDERGRYRFESNFPPPYAGRPSHIHIRITGENFRPLVTQHYPAAGRTEGTFDLVLAPIG